jgi:hypothetical protein
MPWTHLDNLAANAPLPEGYRYKRLAREDIAGVVRALAAWYPGIAVGNASCHLDERFYLEEVVLDGEPERPFTPRCWSMTRISCAPVAGT